MIYQCQDCGEQTYNTKWIGSIETHTCDKCHEKWSREYDYQQENEQWRERSLICPHCNFEYEDYDAYQYGEDDYEETECISCGKKFDLEVEEIKLFSTKRSLCEMPEDWKGESE